MRATSAKRLCLPTLLIALASGCGTPGPPQPPSLNLAKPVSDLKATRTGDEITLSWTVPTETTDGATFRHRGSTKICRAINQPRIDQAAQCTVIVTLATPAKQQTANAVTPVPTEASASDYATFVVEVDNDRDRNAGFSNQVQVPTAAVSLLNGNPASQLTSDGVLVTVGVTPRDEALTQTLELRRSEKGAPHESTVARRTLELPNGEVGNVELRDDNFGWERTYAYRVVIVATSKLPNGTTAVFDGAATAPIEVVTHDVFPPAVPIQVQAVFSGQLAGQQPSIDLTWNPVLDRDLAGYFVYRRRQDETAVTKLNQQPLSAPAYSDKAIQPGSTYFYSVTAIDERGNESKRSEEASESVPR
jgi:hypothetical protein